MPFNEIQFPKSGSEAPKVNKDSLHAISVVSLAVPFGAFCASVLVGNNDRDRCSDPAAVKFSAPYGKS